jgi:hypothetical protein
MTLIKKSKKIVANVQQITAPNLWLDIENAHINITDMLSDESINQSAMFHGDLLDITIGNSGLKLAGLIVKENQHVIAIDDGDEIMIKKNRNKK